MSGILGLLQELYIRFMVWLGAEAPSGYEHLAPVRERPDRYTLQAGETIFTVARKFGVHYELIAKANNIEKLDSIGPGQTLVIPGPDWKPEPDREAPPEPEPDEEVAPDEPPEKVVTPPAPEPLAPPVTPAPEQERPAEDDSWVVDDEFLREEPAETPGEAPVPETKPTPNELAPAPVQEKLPEFKPEEAPEEPAPVDEEMLFRYEVQRGDTLNSVARRYGVTVKALVEANDIEDPGRISPGQKLIIPGYSLPKAEAEAPPEAPPAVKPPPDLDGKFVYTVAAGDTLGSIAKRYGITVRELIEANHDLEDPNLIRVGQKLVIPGVLQPPPSAPPTPPTPTTRPTPLPISAVDPDFPFLGPANAVRALYISYFAIGHSEFRERVFELLDSTELNAVVIDAKSDYGWMSYPTKIALAREIGANRPTAKDFEETLARFSQQGVYTIARIVTFKDNPLAKNHPELAVKTKEGAIWRDNDDLAWTDPFLKPVWDYNIEIAVEAAKMGFDEIQFDYLRFPTAGQAGAPYFSQEITKESRVAAITGFLSTARGQLKPLGVKIAADTFGYTCWRKDDTIIGQDIDRMGQYLDVLCPMLYPSTFGHGIPGYKFAVAHPYEIVYESALRAVNRVKSTGCAVRPWIQDFRDYRFDRRTYGREEIQAQIKGCFDSGSEGFLVYDPQVKYTDAAYAPAVKVAPSP